MELEYKVCSSEAKHIFTRFHRLAADLVSIGVEATIYRNKSVITLQIPNEFTSQQILNVGAICGQYFDSPMVQPGFSLRFV